MRAGGNRNAFLIFVALVWLGILSGFGLSSYMHLSTRGLDYPVIVHFHAVVFVGWMVLFTTQVALIRNRRPDLHRKLGLLGVALAVVMTVLGPATALIVNGIRYTADHNRTPEFLAVQFTDILVFATLTGSGLLLRAAPSAHKRLMLLGLFYVSAAGFARLLNGVVAYPIGEGFWGEMVGLYFFSDVLILSLGVYDYVTRKRLHPAYVMGVVWVIAVPLTAQSLLHNNAWKALSLRLIGY